MEQECGGNWNTGKACSNQPVYSFGETLPKCVGFDKKKDNRADVFFNENRFSGAHYFLRLHDTHQLV